MEDLACGSLELSRALERVMEVYHPRMSTLEPLQVSEHVLTDCMTDLFTNFGDTTPFRPAQNQFQG